MRARFSSTVKKSISEKGELRFKDEGQTLCLTNTNILMLRKGREIFSGTGRELIESKDLYIHEFIRGTEMSPEIEEIDSQQESS